MRIITLALLLLSACASAPQSRIALERPDGKSEIQSSIDTDYCNTLASGYQSIAIKCMQAQGYRLVRLPAQ